MADGILDTEILADLLDALGEEDTRDIAEIFVSNSQLVLDQLHSALEAEARDEYLRHAHSMKGAASAVGADALSELASRAQENAETAALAELATWVQEMTALREKSIVAINELLSDA